MCAGYRRSKHQVTSSFTQDYHQYITSSTRLQRRVKHNYYEDIEDNLHSLLLSPPSIIRFGQGFNN
jgi:hypothetical protein